MSKLKNHVNFTVTSYYTIGTPYEDLAKRLAESLDKFDIPYDLRGIKSVGDWHENTRYKAIFMRDMLREYDRLVFIDADGVVVEYPSLFDSINADIGVTYRMGIHLLSGTLFMRNTDKTNAVIGRWIELNKATDSCTLEQQNLQKAIEEVGGVSIYKLPQSYTKIYDLMAHEPESVIMHYQASRQYRRKFWR